MDEKKHTYEAATMGLPSLRVVLGEVPHPDGESRRPFHPFPFVTEKPEVETTKVVRRLIGYIKETK